MMGKWRVTLLIALWLIPLSVPTLRAQELTSQQTAKEKAEQEKKALEEQAVALLDQLVSEAAALRLPENRLRIQIVAADLLWSRNEERARSLFDAAMAGVLELMGKPNTGDNNRRNANANRPNANPSRSSAMQLRQELVLAVARHNAPLAYQFLQLTQPPPSQMPADPQTGRPASADVGLEQRLLAQIARTDPQLAVKSAEEMLEKGQYANSMAQVLMQLQSKDPDAAAKFSEKLLKRLQMENLLAKPDAGNLALFLLRAGPRPADNASDSAKVSLRNPAQVLTATAYGNLLESVIAAALKANAPAAGNGRGPNGRGGANGFGGRGGNPQPPMDTAQMEQNTARGLLAGLQSMLPQIDQYLPGRATAVRQKLTQMGMDNSPRAGFTQIAELMEQGTSESLMTAAATAPAGMQSRIYQQAAMKALEEGEVERARKIANEHLEPMQRGTILQMVESQRLAQLSGDEAMDSIRQALARLSSDEERVRLLTQLSGNAQKENPKLALQILNEAQKLVSTRASSYTQFELQLQVARAFAGVDVSRSFEVLEPGITQLNELLSAAALLNGFEVNVFRDGEMPLQNGSRLSGMVNQYGEELADLAQKDFERARLSAEKFQLLEARIFTRLSIARRVLGGQSIEAGNFGNRNFAPNPPFGRRQQ